MYLEGPELYCVPLSATWPFENTPKPMAWRLLIFAMRTECAGTAWP